MRILYVACDIEADSSDIGSRLALALAKSAQSRGHYVRILATVGVSHGKVVDGVPVQVAPVAKAFKERLGFDVTHVILTRDTFEAAEWLVKSRTPCVLTLIDVFPSALQPRLDDLFPLAGCIAAGSPDLAEILRLNHPNATIRLVPHGFDLRAHDPEAGSDISVPWRIEEEAFLYSQIYREMISRP